MTSLQHELELATLKEWVHVQPMADTAAMGELFIEQWLQAKGELQELVRRHDHDPALQQRVRELAELAGVCQDMHRAQMRRWEPNPYAVPPL